MEPSRDGWNAQMYRKRRESGSAFCPNNSSHYFFKNPTKYAIDRATTPQSVVEVWWRLNLSCGSSHSQSFSWRTCIFSIFCVLPIISAVRLEMAKRSRIPTVLNGHKANGPRNCWDVEQSDWRNGISCQPNTGWVSCIHSLWMWRRCLLPCT